MTTDETQQALKQLEKAARKTRSFVSNTGTLERTHGSEHTLGELAKLFAELTAASVESVSGIKDVAESVASRHGVRTPATPAQKAILRKTGPVVH